MNDDVKEFNMNPELMRELLISALKMLGNEKNIQAPAQHNRVKNVPCTDSEETDEDNSDSNGKLTRRSIITTATAISRDPYTGINHLITYPVIYPTYHHRHTVYG
jgi:hypothetical protein